MLACLAFVTSGSSYSITVPSSPHYHPYPTFVYPCTQMEPPEVPDRKRNVVLYLDPHLVQEAKDRGINLSRFLEYDLRLFLSRMKQSNLEYARGITGDTESALTQNDPQRDGRTGGCGGWDSNPRRATPRDGSSPSHCDLESRASFLGRPAH